MAVEGLSEAKKKKDGFGVEVRTPDGLRTELEATGEETVGHLKERAITSLAIQPAPGIAFFLFLGGKRLADSATLASVGIKDDTVLMLTSEPQVGAATR